MTTATETKWATIYWDDQDPNTVGWGWATHEGEPSYQTTDSGPLGDGYPQGDARLESLAEASDEELIAQFEKEVTDQYEVVRVDR